MALKIVFESLVSELQESKRKPYLDEQNASEFTALQEGNLLCKKVIINHGITLGSLFIKMGPRNCELIFIR